MATAMGDDDPGVTRVARAYAALAEDTREPTAVERPWERSLNHLTAVLVGQRNDHAALRAMVEELTTLVAQEHEAIEAARAERANQRAGDLARHAALLDQLASALAQVDDLAAKVKRQQGQITRLRSEVKKLKSADG